MNTINVLQRTSTDFTIFLNELTKRLSSAELSKYAVKPYKRTDLRVESLFDLLIARTMKTN